MPQSATLLSSWGTLLAYATPAATARVFWQIALDRDLPKLGFPGFVRGGSAYFGAILLGIMAGMMALEVQKVANMAHLLAASVAFYAQDVATIAITAGRKYSKRPQSLFRLIKRLLNLR